LLAYSAVQLLAFFAALNLAYLLVSLLAYYVERKLAFSAYSFARAHDGEKEGDEYKAGCVVVVIRSEVVS
jgi:hypothetical protein